MADLLIGAVMLLAAGVMWGLVGAAIYAVTGGFGVFFVLARKTTDTEPKDLFIFVTFKLCVLGEILLLCAKYGWLGPLIGAIVRAFKNA